MRLYRAMIYVKDLPRMREFYSEMLGVKPVNEKSVDEWAEFDTGSTRFALHAIPADIARADRDFFASAGTRKESRKAHV